MGLAPLVLCLLPSYLDAPGWSRIDAVTRGESRDMEAGKASFDRLVRLALASFDHGGCLELTGIDRCLKLPLSGTH